MKTVFVVDVSINWATNRNWLTKVLDTWEVTQLNLPRQENVNILFLILQEKWDSVTRRWKDNRRLFQNVCLVCIDEVIPGQSVWSALFCCVWF